MAVTVTAKGVTFTNGPDQPNDATLVDSEMVSLFNNDQTLATAITDAFLGKIKDSLTLTLRQSFAGTPDSADHGNFEVERGAATNTRIRWNETSDFWEMTTDGSTYFPIFPLVTAGDPSSPADGWLWYDSTADALKARINGATKTVAVTTDIPSPVTPLSAATQAEMEAASSNTVAATPGRVQNHPGVVKAWVNFNGTGTVAIRASHNVSSITDNGTGNYTVNLTTSFSSANYCVGTSNRGGSGDGTVDTLATGSFKVYSMTTAGALQDVSEIHAWAWGDQ